MGGRGRGGRGRGRGMTLEQLGVQRGEVLPDSIVGPPETYPPLEFRPCQPPQKESVEEYILCIKKEFQEHMQNSQYYIQPEVKSPDIERYSDRYQVLASHRGQLTLNWSRFPKELHPMTGSVTKKRKLKPKKVAVNIKKARTKDINVKETLEELEKKEATTGTEENEEEEEADPENKPEEEVIEELEEVDEELDEGTDYINNYFDNGESYLDEEDDALEEGGVF